MENRKFTGAFPNRGLGTRSLAGLGTRSLNKILQGDAMKVLKEMPEQFVNMIMCSPPYWALRDYGDNVRSIWDGDPECEHEFSIDTKAGDIRFRGTNSDVGNNKNPEIYNGDGKGSFCTKCGAWKGQLGLEPSFELYIKHLCDIFDEAKRVLRDDGTLWVNLGDTYGGSGNRRGHTEETSNLNRLTIGYGATDGNQQTTKGLEKSLVMIPFRFAIEMVSRGWILRNTIIWHKPNCMPSSAKDRFTVDFEYLFFFSKKKKYYFEQQFERYDKPLDRWGGQKIRGDYKSKTKQFSMGERSGRHIRPNIEGRNKRTVWEIPTQSFSEAHFAVYPEELIIIPIQAGCPKYVCKKCGKAKEKIIISESKPTRPGVNCKDKNDNIYSINRKRYMPEYKGEYYTDCGCGAGFEPGIVLDPFFGSGTTGLTALKLGRDFIGIEQNDEYIKLAEKRLASELEQERLAI